MSSGDVMIFKIRLGSWRFTFTLAPVIDIIGVNSQLKDGNHIIMWDFDDVKLEQIEIQLSLIQSIYDLPNIYILNTGKPDHYISYCFDRCKWRKTVEIVAATPQVDPNFFKYGVYRGRWTLRVTPKGGRKPRMVKILHSTRQETVNISELESWVKDGISEKHTLFSLLFPSTPYLWARAWTFCHIQGTSAQNMKPSLITRQ